MGHLNHLLIIITDSPGLLQLQHVPTQMSTSSIILLFCFSSSPSHLSCGHAINIGAIYYIIFLSFFYFTIIIWKIPLIFALEYLQMNVLLFCSLKWCIGSEIHNLWLGLPVTKSVFLLNHKMKSIYNINIS